MIATRIPYHRLDRVLAAAAAGSPALLPRWPDGNEEAWVGFGGRRDDDHRCRSLGPAPTVRSGPGSARQWRGLVALAAVVVAAVAAVATAAEPAPAHVPRAWVTDSAHVLSAADRRALSAMLSGFHRQTHHPIAVLIVPTIGDEPIERFSLRTANEWGLGYPGLNNGVLVTLAIKEGRARIELGTGMARYVTTADVRAIVEGDLVPALRSADYAGGLKRGLGRLMARARTFVVTTAAPPGAGAPPDRKPPGPP